MLGYDEGMSGILQGVGLGLAILATIPATKAINNGQHIKMIITSIVFSVIGLFVIGFAGKTIVFLLPGIILAGVGYVLIMQTTTAWTKNLYPEGNYGQFEGVRIIFNVMIPMPEEGEAEKYAKAVQNACNEYVDKCLAPSVAVGISVKEKVDEYLAQVFSDAEYEMFENKMNMKKVPGYQDRLRKAL